jgi:hypothetical protein
VNEREVIRTTRSVLQRDGLLGAEVLDLYTDAHPSLLPDRSLRPFQRFTLAFDGFVAHPDLVGRLNDGETTFAIEAKGSTDLLKGIAQAELYRAGFHLVLLASAGVPSPDLLELARGRNVGILAVSPQQLDVVTMPPLHLPRLRHAERIRKQFLTTDTLSRQFVFNLPTHYLCFAPVLRSWQAQHGPAAVQLAALEPFTRTHYPILPQKSQSFRAALSGAAKLGLLRIQGQEIVATVVGEAVAELLPDAARLAVLHQKLTGSATGSTLAQLNPEAGAVLRCLLYNDPVCRFIVDRLGDAGRTALSMRALAALSAEYDKTMAVSIFFKPESISDIVDDQGRLMWYRIQPQHFRSTTFMQYKSILKHAGFIKPHRLGGASAKDYDPDTDLWELV